MKRMFLTLGTVFITLCPLFAQNIHEGEAVLVYSLPKTAIYLDVEYEVCEHKAGSLAQYASLLDIKDAVTETDTTYRFISVSTGINTTPDSERVFKVLPEKGFQPQLLTLNSQGILAGFNIIAEAEKTSSPRKSASRPHQETPPALPLSEEALSATGKQRAEIVRQQILHLREARTFLLLGESESQPSDGHQLEQLLRAIHEEEMALTALFTGTRTYTRCTDRIYYTPSSTGEEVILRFSPTKGIVSSEEDGTPLRITTLIHRPIRQAPPTPTKGKKTVRLSSVYYNIPGACDYTLFYGDDQLLHRTIDVAQFGIEVPLSLDLLTPATHIQFNTHTGNILSIRQE